MKKYNQLTREQRYQISALKQGDLNQKQIAGIIKVSPSTICRELKRNTESRGIALNKRSVARLSARGQR